MMNMKEELGQNDIKQSRAQKSLESAKKAMAKKQVQVKEENPHLAQLEFDIENDKNKTIVSNIM